MALKLILPPWIPARSALVVSQTFFQIRFLWIERTNVERGVWSGGDEDIVKNCVSQFSLNFLFCSVLIQCKYEVDLQTQKAISTET